MEGVKRLEGRIKFKSFIFLLRPRQWIKNLFLFAPLLFSRNIDKPQHVMTVFYAFLCFCMITSTVYIFNDIRDLEKDRKHREKGCGRWLRYYQQTGSAEFMIFMLPVSAAISFMLDYSFGFVVMAYLLNNLIYTLYVKILSYLM